MENNQVQQDLGQQRAHIDILDKELLNLLMQRTMVVQKIAEIKKQSDIPVLQAERIQVMISERKKIAKELGLNPLFVERLFMTIINESMQLEENV
jgi:chorismate mutase-like protein